MGRHPSPQVLTQTHGLPVSFVCRFASMRLLVRRLSPVAAAAYLLAGWLAGALHAHAPAATESEQICTTCTCGHSHGHSKPHDDENSSEHEHGDHGCVVCQFFAQPPLAVEPVRLVADFEPISFAVEAVAPSNEVVAIAAWWSRGPPIG